jgi:4-aminobutyrate aminotransferase/4-aminobutyrate aminotransferase/(S)-3-amino-2-methylpropionate transaminase
MGGNPVACAAGLETIKIIEEEGLVEHTKKMGHYFVTRLKELGGNHNCVGEIRGKGFIIGLELVKDQTSKKVAIEEALEVKRYLRENGLLVVLNESTLRILPPFITEEQHIDSAVELIDKSLDRIDKRSR